jgi:hypothetical protein
MMHKPKHLVLWSITTLIALLAGLAAYPAAAQNNGQLCVESFEDRNGNGTQDAGEPLLTRDVSVNLLDASGVIIASALLDTSARAAQGLVCFTNLAAGQYSLEVNSAAYQSSEPGGLTVEVRSGEQPQILTFGGARVTGGAVESAADAGAATFNRDDLLERALVAGAGAAVVMLVMAVIGFIIYSLTLRRRYRRVLAAEAAYRQRTTTGSMRAVRPSDAGEFRRPQ